MVDWIFALIERLKVSEVTSPVKKIDIKISFGSFQIVWKSNSIFSIKDFIGEPGRTASPICSE